MFINKNSYNPIFPLVFLRFLICLRPSGGMLGQICAPFLLHQSGGGEETVLETVSINTVFIQFEYSVNIYIYIALI